MIEDEVIEEDEKDEKDEDVLNDDPISLDEAAEEEEEDDVDMSYDDDSL